MKVIIAGSRTIEDYTLILESMSGVGATEIVSGCARGVDTLGEMWASNHFISIKQFPADWDTHGKSAGYIRNSEMADYADFLVALWDGESKGTDHMINLMKKLDKPGILYIIKDNKIVQLEKW